MSFWQYVGEFLMFRWLYRQLSGSHDRVSHEGHISDCHHYADDYDTYGHHDAMGYHIHDDRDWDTYNDYGDSQSYDNFLDEQDDYDMMDDL